MNTESTKLLTATCPQVDVKLCEERLMHISPEEGTRIVVTNVTVDEYRNNKTLNSYISTRIEVSIKIMSLYNIFR